MRGACAPLFLWGGVAADARGLVYTGGGVGLQLDVIDFGPDSVPEPAAALRALAAGAALAALARRARRRATAAGAARSASASTAPPAYGAAWLSSR